MDALIPAETIQQHILIVTGKRVLLDADLARFYGVGTRELNRAVARNPDRFPEDFAFRLTLAETQALMFQPDTSKPGRGGTRKPANVFTEQGVAMLSSVLRSKQAVAVNIEIMRAFVRLREILSTHKELAQKLEELEKKYDIRFRAVFDALRSLMAVPAPAKKEIGFKVKEHGPAYKAKKKSR